MIFSFYFSKNIFSTVTTNLGKSEIPASTVDVFWKCLVQFARNKSMHDGLLGFLKQFGSLLRFLRLLALGKSFKRLYFDSALRSPKPSKLS